MNILCSVDVPTTTNSRVYHLSKMDKLSLQKVGLYTQQNLVHSVL